MNRERERSWSKGLESSINVTPLVDVVLVLLIVFMVMLPMMPSGFFGSLPAKGVGAGDPLVLQIGADGTLRLNRTLVAEGELGQRLGVLCAAGSHRTLFVDADDGVGYERFVRVLDLCRRPGGVDSIGFLVDRPATAEPPGVRPGVRPDP